MISIFPAYPTIPRTAPVKISEYNDRLFIFEPEDNGIFLGEALAQKPFEKPVKSAKELNYETKATYRRTPEYLKTICSLSNCFIVIDEANDLDCRVWPYLKRIIDAGVPIVFAGLPKVRTFLISEHPDILSRLKTLILYPIEVEDFIDEYKDIEQEAIEQIYMATRGDMRKFKEICTDCQDRAKELKYTFVDLNLALEFISALPPQQYHRYLNRLNL